MTAVEHGVWRAPPPTPYVWGGQVLSVSAATVALTSAALRSAGAVEAACVWLGPMDSEGNAQVAAVIMPRQMNRARNYVIAGDAVLEVANYGRSQGWTVVGAVHSHPGPSVEHSTYDDEMTPSRRAVSIVFPCYGNWVGPWPRGLGVHAFAARYWHFLTEAEAERRVRIDNGQQALWKDLR